MRNPKSKAAAATAIERSATALGLSVQDVLDAADDLLDGRLSPEDWLTKLCAGQEDQAAADPVPTSESRGNHRPKHLRPNVNVLRAVNVLRRPEGATIEEVVKVTGWNTALAHRKLAEIAGHTST